MTLHLPHAVRQLTRTQGAQLVAVLEDAKRCRRNHERAAKKWLRSTAKARGLERARAEKRKSRKARAERGSA